MKTRPYSQADHVRLSNWWTAHGWPPVSSTILPPNGYIVGECAAAFLYLTDSPIAWMEWLVADPEAPKEFRSACINQLVDHIAEVARQKGASLLFTSTNHPALEKRLTENGFQVGDRGMVLLFKQV